MSVRAVGAVPVGVEVRRLRPEWPVLATPAAAVALVAALSLALRGSEIPLLLAHLLVLVLASGSAYLLDDPAAQVTAVVPRSLLRRRLAVALPGLLVVAVAWCAVIAFWDWRSPSIPAVALTWELAGLIALGVAAAAVVSRRGEAEPGNLVVSSLGLVFIGVLLVQPMMHLTVLVTSSEDPTRATWWAAVILGSGATAFASSTRPT